MRKLFIALTACLVLVISACTDSDFAKGEKAYEEKNYIQAVKYYHLAAEAGHAEAQFALGLMYVEGLGVVHDNEEAVRWLRLAAEQELVQAQYAMGAMYENIFEDDKEARKWYNKATETTERLLTDEIRLLTEQGNAKIQYGLGRMFQDGQDYKEAAKWYRLAAEQGYAKAQYELGGLYVEGKGVSENNTEAAEWYRLAAEQEHAEAQYILGKMHEHGVGVLVDKSEAAKWYRKAAEQGIIISQESLGEIYEEGGSGMSRKEAYMWSFLAAENGREDAKSRVTRLERRLSPEEIATAQAEAEEIQVRIDKTQ